MRKAFTMVPRVAMAGWLLAFAIAAAPQAGSADFDAISIKPLKPGVRPVPFRADPAGVHATGISLRMLVLRAYGLENYQVIGGEPWTGTEMYSVQATTRTPATHAQVLAMLQSLLQQRFGLKLVEHPKTENVLDLVVAQGGIKFRELAFGEFPSRPPVQHPDAEEAIMFGETTGDVAGYLNFMLGERVLGARVVDHTGLAGTYNLVMVMPYEWATYPGGRGTRVLWGGLRAELARQLGLKLVPNREQVKYFEIAGAKKPTPE